MTTATSTDYKIVIPTYGRPDGVRNNTLSYLSRTNVPRDNIFLFVASKEEQEQYIAANGEEWKKRIVIGVKGLCPQRHFISEYFPKGERIVSMDDDVSSIRFLKLDEPLPGTTKPLKHPCSLREVTNLDGLISHGFSLCEDEERNIPMWGLYQVENKGFLHPRVSTGLKFVMGHFVAFYAGDPVFKEIHDFPMKDDFFWSLWHYAKSGETLRFDNICVKAKQHTGAGGTCEDMEAKLLTNNKTVEKICGQFPDLAFPKQRRTKDPYLSRYSEIRLAPKTNSIIPAHHMEEFLGKQS
jgi:hypothetical protein